MHINCIILWLTFVMWIGAEIEWLYMELELKNIELD